MKITPLPGPAARIACNLFGPTSQVYVTEATWGRVGTNAAAPDVATSEDLAWYAVFAAGGHMGYARVRKRDLLDLVVPVAFATGKFDVSVTVLGQFPAGPRILTSLPREAVMRPWILEMIRRRNYDGGAPDAFGASPIL